MNETPNLSVTDDSEPWYSAKMIFGTYDRVSGRRMTYEERIVLFRANSFEHAIELAEEEAQRYCEGLNDGKWQTRFEGFIDVFHLFDSNVGHGTEIYSNMRESELDAKEFIDRYYDDSLPGLRIQGILKKEIDP